MTPGTVVLGISDDRTKIYIHAIDFSTKEEEVASIKSSLEKVVRGGERMIHVIMMIALIIVALSMIAMFIRVILGPLSLIELLH